MAKHWYNNGVIQVFRETPPDETFVPGMLESSKQKMREHEFTEEHRKHIGEAGMNRIPWNKGKQWSDDVKEKISQSLTGNIPWNKGLTASADERVKQNTDKANNAKIEKYGSAFPNNNMNEEHKQKISQSNKGKHGQLKGYKWPKEFGEKISKAKMGHPVSQETREKLSKAFTGKKLTPAQLEIFVTKQYITRKKNNSFNKSEPEEKLYQELLEANKTKTILRQYKDPERYPFYCDFYIVEDDLFIELNAHWSHGGRPYDKDDPECQKQLLEWREKANTSKFVQNAIITWTERDVKKAQCAKEHNLNYKVIY